MDQDTKAIIAASVATVLIVILAVIVGSLGGLGYIGTDNITHLSNNLYVGGIKSESRLVIPTNVCYGTNVKKMIPFSYEKAVKAASHFGIAKCTVQSGVTDLSRIPVGYPECGSSSAAYTPGAPLVMNIERRKLTSTLVAKAANELMVDTNTLVMITYTPHANPDQAYNAMISMAPVDVTSMMPAEDNIVLNSSPAPSNDLFMDVKPVVLFAGVPKTLQRLSYCRM